MTTPHAQNFPQELLHRIFLQLDYDSNARNARVCKAWTDGALNEVWRDLYDWTSALASLAGTVSDPNTRKMSFAPPLSKSIWDRFLSNSHRVRSIDGTASHIRWSEGAMFEIMSTRPLSILFPNLQSLRIGTRTGPQFGALIMHHSISALKINIRHGSNTEWAKAPPNFQASLEAGAFPSLQSITFGASLAHARQFFTTPNFPTSSLISIFLNVPLPHQRTPSHLQEHLNALTDSCRGLERLELYMTEIDNLRMSIQDARDSPIYTFADICSIIRLRHLKTFTIRYVQPIDITDYQIESLAAGLPHLEELVLNAYPMFTPESTLTLRAIIQFARHCPRITKLRLYLRTTSINIPPSIGEHFHHLAQLCIGYSTIRCDVENVSWLLFPLLPRGFQVLSSLDEDCDEYTHVWEPEWWETKSRDKIREAGQGRQGEVFRVKNTVSGGGVEGRACTGGRAGSRTLVTLVIPSRITPVVVRGRFLSTHGTILATNVVVIRSFLIHLAAGSRLTAPQSSSNDNAGNLAGKNQWTRKDFDRVKPTQDNTDGFLDRVENAINQRENATNKPDGGPKTVTPSNTNTGSANAPQKK
ncbi:uncharacterized protein STEHIDRAFT_169621 [Stereum hirsutum FP-91666 SS1]|uniref:uncharacterized protein n=1 Tax=Stereum hirsutum (strain FP-91666) TaxID=721885 RepID=UPI00044493BF|nr:uncharacterized protein STEHIDRAFT_169621 [Stereum hirsutum FP-91666 SS1]EIM84704.1 hypothetical protein STEHIDRAFT_169621 [Stereum hirsutum FP-91666 SS1]